MKSKDWVEAAVTFYDYWFSVSDEVREKLVAKAKEFEIFSKTCGSLSKESMKEYKRIVVSRVKAQCQGSDDFLGIGDIFLSGFFSMLVDGDFYVKGKTVATKEAVKELLKQGFNPTQVIEIVTRGEDCNSEKVAEILAKVSETKESHHCSGRCEHCSGHGDPQAAAPNLLEQAIKASQEEQTDVLIALLKQKLLPLQTIAVVTGLSEEEIKASKGYAV